MPSMNDNRERGLSSGEQEPDIGDPSQGYRPPVSMPERGDGPPIRGADGTSNLLLSPVDLLEKLATLVPPPRFHLLRYHGVLAAVRGTEAA